MSNNEQLPELPVDVSQVPEQQEYVDTGVPVAGEVDSTPIPSEPESTTDTYPADYFDHVVTQADVDLNPGENLQVGETVGIPVDYTLAEEIPAEPVETEGTVEPEVRALIERKESTHWVKVYKDAEKDYWEVFLIHKSSLCTHQTCNILRDMAKQGVNLGFHKIVTGTKESVMSTLETL